MWLKEVFSTEQAVYDYTIEKDTEAKEYARRVLFMAKKRAKHADWESLNKSLKVQQEVENSLLESMYKDMAWLIEKQR